MDAAATFWASRQATLILQYPVCLGREQQLADRRIQRLQKFNDQEHTFLSIHSLHNANKGRGRTNAFGVYIGHKICHRVPATSATLLSRPAITMSEGPKDQKSRCPASKQVISCPMAVK